MSHQLNQGTVWVDKDGNKHLIRNMSGRYALNAHNMMQRNAQIIAFKYTSYLMMVPLPDGDTAAFDMVSSDIDRELERIRTDALGWLLDKPLMQALMNRVIAEAVPKGVIEDTNPSIARIDMPEEHILPGFEVKPPVEDKAEWAQQPGDEIRVFLVVSGDYESRSPDAVFVGNRLAAHRYAAEINRYNTWADADVDVMDDSCIGGSLTYGQIRKYPTSITLIKYTTLVEFGTARIDRQNVTLGVSQADDPQIKVEASQVSGRRGQQDLVEIVTTGPEGSLENVKRSHYSRVASTRASILESIPYTEFPEEGK